MPYQAAEPKDERQIRLVAQIAAKSHRVSLTDTGCSGRFGSWLGGVFASCWIALESMSKGSGLTVGGETALLAWLAKKAPTLVQHFPAIHGDSAQTKGTVLLSIVSSS